MAREKSASWRKIKKPRSGETATSSRGDPAMKRSIQYELVWSVALVLSLLVSCASPPKPPKAVKTVAFITNSTSDFWKVAHKGCQKADAELADAKVAFKTTNTGTGEEQTGL